MKHFTHWKQAVLASAMLLSGQTLLAASHTCWMAKEPYKCTTESVSAHPINHFVHIDISPRVKYRVIDTNNGAVVSSGTSGWTGTRKTIGGLYSRYHVKAEALGPLGIGPVRAFATINNN